MNYKFIPALFMLGLGSVASFAQAQPKLIEKVLKSGNDLVIPYEKYQLSNGLIVIIHEDHSDPIVHVDVTYHVGSDREEIGRSGFAHFFEHMMFQGSDHVADEEHFKIVTEAGGSMNGTTNTDRTNYFETLPSNQLEVALWLESDRMGFLLDAVTQQKFEVQRATVKNERGQRYDNAPYGLVFEKTNAALYPQGHPYSWSTIGYMDDLDAANVEDLKKFFLRWYGPNNATLTIAGDVKPQEALKIAEKYFGGIKRCPDAKAPEKTIFSLDANRYISYEDNVRFPMLQITYPTVPQYHADDAALDVLADIIGGGGKNSIFYKDFVKTQLAVNANAFQNSQEIAGNFIVRILPFPGKTLTETEQQVQKAFEEFEKNGVSDDDLARFKASFESSLTNSLASVSGKASRLAAFQTYTGNPNYIRTELKSYMDVTKEDVVRVYNKYIKGKGAVVLSVVPKGKLDMVAQKDNFTITRPSRPATFDNTIAKLTYVKAKDKFDRSKKPIPGANPVVKVPDYWTEQMSNGLKLIGVKNAEVPLITVQLSIGAGHIMEQNNPSKAGIAQLLAGMLDESSMKHTAEALSNDLEKLGSEVKFDADKNNITLTVTSLVKNLPRTLEIAQEKLFQPKFDTADFKRLKKQQMELIANQSTQPVTIANNVYGKVLYGKDHIMGVPNLGTVETVGNITLDDVKAYYINNVSPGISNMVVVGDINKEQVMPLLNYFAAWVGKTNAVPAAKPAPVIDKTKIYLVDKEKAPQSEIRIGYVALPYDATGTYYRATLMNFVLGGAFNSRINLNLREDKGWTYGARSVFSGDKNPGTYTAAAGIKAAATDSSIVEFIKEIKNYADNGITDKELEFTKNSIGQSEALKYETPSQKAGFLRRIVAFDLNKDFVETQNTILKNITKAEIDEQAKHLLPYNNMVIVVVGDAKTYKERLLKLGYDVVELDKEGNEKKM